MNLQTRRISGSSFSAEDKLEVTFNSDNQPMSSVVHTIELVSGIDVTHGGSGKAGEYLHYKSVERDADSDGVIDYSDIEMALVQASQGTSIIKVVCEAVTKENSDRVKSVFDAYKARQDAAGVTEENPKGIDGNFTEEHPTDTLETITLKTGDIILEWTEDVFV